MKILLALLFASTAHADEFWKYWSDGKAELDGYALTQPRYGETRAGRAVLVFVTEDFADDVRVKPDPGKHPASDVYPVMKLNFVRNFQTGIYDYSVLTSTFVRTEPDLRVPVKISFSAQEWCGHVYAQWNVRGARAEGVSHSYFDGEADQTMSLDVPTGGIFEEQVPILIRGLRGDYLAAGSSRTVPFLPSSLRARFAHHPQKWGQATIRRATDGVTWTVEEQGGVTTTWTTEKEAPHRIVSWKSSDGESGKLLGSARLPYWELHGEGGEKYLKQLGLQPLRAPLKR